jgi:putative transposase
MAARSSIDGAGWLREQLELASPDLLREMVRLFADALGPTRCVTLSMACAARSGRTAEVVPGAGVGYSGGDGGAGDLAAAVGVVFPDWLLERRRCGGAGADYGGRRVLPAGVSTGEWRSWWRRWASPG